MGNRRKKAAKNILFGCAFGLSIMILMLGAGAAAGEVAADVEKILREVRQDQPVPAVPYLKKGEPMNVDCVYYQGKYAGIEISVETHPNSRRVASILLQVPGPDRTEELLPAVKRVIGSPRAGNPDKSEYGWEWPNYRTGSLHYAKGAGPGEGFTVVSLFYR